MGKILGNLLSLVIGSIIVWLIVWFLFYKPEANSSLDDIYGSGAVAEVDNTFEANETVTLKEIVKNNNVEVGSIYTITGTGEYFNATGTITYKIAFDNDLVVIGFIEEKYEHTGEPYKNYVISFLENLVENKVNIKEFNSLGDQLDGIAEPTAGSTTSLLMGMLEDLKELVDDETPLTTPVEDIYGVGATAIVDEGFLATDEITSKETVQLNGNNVGSLYTISLTSTYQDDNDDIKTVIFKIALNNDLDILGFIEVEYGHTGGGFKNNVLNYLKGLVDTNINDLTDLDGNTGSTNTKTGILNILYELKDLLAN